MKPKNIITFMIVVFFTINLSLAQEGVPTNATSLFEEYPVDLSSGLPQISIPLGTYPTRIKNKNINLSVNYHPSSVAVYNQNMGDAGHGWSLYKSAGTISKTNQQGETVHGKYTYNFFGFNGSFEVIKANGTLKANLLENGTGFLKIILHITYNDGIPQFTFIDNDGNKYLFETTDTLFYKKTLTEEVPYFSTYHLSRVITSTGDLAVQYHYDQLSFKFHTQNSFSSINVLNKITLVDFGEINFSFGSYNTPKSYPIVLYNGITIKDLNNNIVKEFNFVYQNRYTDNNRYRLIGLEEKNTVNSDQLSYHFYYKSTLINGDKYEWATDTWGYRTLINKFCKNSDVADLPSLSSIADGVLQKITYPAGGSVLYEFETNTYTYNSAKQMDSIKNQQTDEWEIDPMFFTRVSAENLHNLNINTIYSKTFNALSPGALTFSVSGTKEFYFKFDADSWEETGIVDGNPNQIIEMYPTFILKRNGTVVQNFSMNNPDYYNYQNHCLGRKMTLQSGSYTIEMTNTNLTTGRVSLNTATAKPNPKKWWNGGGVRIKTIAYFDSPDIDNLYLQLGFTNPQPVRRIDYDYNLFDEPDRSSGQTEALSPSVFFSNFGKKISYKNVTVYDSNKEGKTQHTFYIPLDKPTKSNLLGKIRSVNVLNSSNQLVQQTLYSYTNQELLTSNDLPPTIAYQGVPYPKSVKSRIYDGSQYIEKISEVLYNKEHQVVITASSSSFLNTIEKQRYYYSTFGDEPFSLIASRSLLSSTEKYLNNEKLYTSRIIYSDQWTTLAEDEGVGVIIYPPLPQNTESSKNGTDYKVVSTVNLYDKYSNIVEYENEQGTTIVNLWGYNKTNIVAKIEGISYSQIPQNLITDIQTASNGTNETALLTALNNLRNHSSMANALITTYTYKPLIGISTQTDYRGRRINYFYDGFGRLKEVRDHNNNILTEKEYYYQTQN